MIASMPRSPFVVMIVVAGLVLSLAAGSVAQESESRPASVNSEAPAEEATTGHDVTAWERLIYLPYRNLKSVFENQGASVVLPYLEYLKVLEAAGGLPAMSSKPPVAAVITESAYVARVEKDVARIAATLNVQVLDRPWADIPVEFGDAAVGRIKCETGTALLRGQGNGRYSLLLSDKGRHTVHLDLVARIHTSPDGRSLELKCPSVGITTFELVVPEADQSVELTPRLVALPVEVEGNVTRVKASLGATERIEARWNPRAGQRPQMDLLTSVTNSLHVSVDQGLVHTEAQLEFNVLRGELTELELAIPPGYRILDVTAADAKVRGWQIADHAKRQIVTVETLSAIEDSIVIEVHTESPLPSDSFRVAGIAEDGTFHGIHSLGAVRESGQLVISHGTDLTLSIDQQTGLSRITQDELRPSLRRTNSLAWQFYNPRIDLSVTARPVEPRLIADQDSYIVFGDEELRLTSQIAWTVERAGVFELSLAVPDQLTIETVSSDSMSEYGFDDRQRTLTISLSKKELGPISTTVIARREFPHDEQQIAMQLPLLEPRNVARETGRVLVHAPLALEIITDEDDLVGVYPQPIDASARRGADSLVSAWNYTRRPVRIPVRTERKPTRLTAHVGTMIDVQQEVVRVTATLRYTIENAGIDTFRLSVPESVADRMQIRSLATESGGAIKQKSLADAADGQVTWTIVTQQEVLGDQVFEVSWDIKPDIDQESRRIELVVEPLRVSDPAESGAAMADRITLSRIVGELSVRKDRSLSVSAEATGEDIELIDVRELERLPQEGYLAWRYYRQPVRLAVTAEKHEIQEVVRTIVSRALVEVVIDRDPLATYLCRYRMTSSERQRLRIDLPENIELHDPLVNNRRAALERSRDESVPDGWEAYAVNVARTESSDETFFLTLHFRAPVTPEDQRPFDGMGGLQFIRFPAIGGHTASGVVVQQLKTVVWVPDEYAFVGAPEGFTADGISLPGGFWPVRLRQRPRIRQLGQWIGKQDSGGVDFPRLGHPRHYSSLGGRATMNVRWWHMPSFVWWLSGTVLLVGFVLRRTTWENRLTVVLLAAFVATVVALEDSESVVHVLAAAMYGLLAAAVLWLLHTLPGSANPRHLPGPPSDSRPVATGRPPAAPPPSSPPAATAAVIPPPGAFDVVSGMMRRRSDG